MASSALHTRKDGSRYYEIRYNAGRNAPNYCTKWDVPEGWSNKAIERALARETAEFERRCKAGEILSKSQQKEKQLQEEAERAKLKTVAQYADSVYLATKSISVAENTRSSYKNNIDKHIKPVIGDMLLTEVSSAMLTKLLTDYQAAGHAHESCKKLYNILNGIFDMAFMDDSIPMNPMLKVKHPVQKKDDKMESEEDKAYTVEESQHILECISQEPLQWQVFIILTLDTGARRGEINGLRWTDIDFDNGTVTICNNLQYTPAKGVYETTPKNGKGRKVDIGKDTIEMLRALRLEQAKKCVSKYVFNHEGLPVPIHPQSPTRYFKRFGEKYGIKDFHPHKLRHTNASIALTSGADIVSVSERLGHSDTSVTLRMYAHANEESIRRAGQVARDAIKRREA